MIWEAESNMAHNKTRGGVRDTETKYNDERNVCAVDICKEIDNLRLCGQCKVVRYCSKEHQKLDWKKHKSQCMKDKNVGLGGPQQQADDDQELPRKSPGSTSDVTSRARPRPTGKDVSVLPDDFKDVEPNDPETNSDTHHKDSAEQTMISMSKKILPREDNSSSPKSASSPSLSHSPDSSSSCCTTSDNNNPSFEQIQGKKNPVNDELIKIPSDLQSQIQKESVLFSANFGSGYPLKPIYSENNQLKNKPPQPYDASGNTKDTVLDDIVQRVVKSLTTQHGICVLDKFLDESRGLEILKEVQSMHSSGQFQDGQVVRSRDDSSKIRGDQITWRNGDEPDCTNISFLISILDSILAQCNGKLEDYNINGRTKAMIACYPGKGTHYVRHVDNPNNDGRCITCIYYLNKNWDVSKNGGLLKVYPEGSDSPATIAPVFNRLLFFYSDRRNPHEVLPAYATRFAITVWYLDGNQKSTGKRSSIK